MTSKRSGSHLIRVLELVLGVGAGAEDAGEERTGKRDGLGFDRAIGDNGYFLSAFSKRCQVALKGGQVGDDEQQIRL